MLFSERSIWTMMHGIVFGGFMLLAFSGALQCVWSLRPAEGLSSAFLQRQGRFLARITAFLAVLVWLTVIVGALVNFPQYRAVPPEGADLTQYPKALIQSNPDTSWLHSFGMEVKEHMPWIPAMVMTALAFVANRHRSGIAAEPALRRAMLTLLAVVFGAVLLIALLGMFINKAAPLQ